VSAISEPADGLRGRLTAALRAALRARDPVAIAALRTALGSIANAEAVSPDRGPAARTSSLHLAGAVAGLGAAEVPRRELAEPAVAEIVRTEIAERQQAAGQYAGPARLTRPQG
jgi:hypothetical protein